MAQESAVFLSSILSLFLSSGLRVVIISVIFRQDMLQYIMKKKKEQPGRIYFHKSFSFGGCL